MGSPSQFPTMVSVRLRAPQYIFFMRILVKLLMTNLSIFTFRRTYKRIWVERVPRSGYTPQYNIQGWSVLNIFGTTRFHNFLPDATQSNFFKKRPNVWNLLNRKMWISLHTFHKFICTFIIIITRGVMVIVVGKGHGNTSSNPGQDWLHFT